jgi:glycoprotease/Kae1 family metallohydrolase
MTARALSAARKIPLLPLNHLEGHALTATLTDAVPFPYLLLLVSGGHTQLLAVEGVGRYRRLGTTIDDALGEAFDKTAKLLGLPFPGGPNVERAARAGDSKRFALPRPLHDAPGCDFSFSGLKTAVRLAAEACAPLSEKDIADLAASFQAAAVDVALNRTRARHVRRRDRRFALCTCRRRRGRFKRVPAHAIDCALLRRGRPLCCATAKTLHRQRRDDRLGRLRTTRRRAFAQSGSSGARTLAA